MRRKSDFFDEPAWPTSIRPATQIQDRSSFINSSSSNSLSKHSDSEDSQRSIKLQLEDEKDLLKEEYGPQERDMSEFDCDETTLHGNRRKMTDKNIKFQEQLPSQPSLQGKGFYQQLQSNNFVKQEDLSQQYIAYDDSDFELQKRRKLKRKSCKKTPKINPHKTTYKILSLEEKEYLMKQLKVYSLSEVSKMYGISVNNLARWRSGCERKTGAGRKVHSEDLQQRLIDWILAQKRLGVQLTRRKIQQAAISWSEKPNFKASKGWFQRFAKRNLQLGLYDPETGTMSLCANLSARESFFKRQKEMKRQE